MVRLLALFACLALSAPLAAQESGPRLGFRPLPADAKTPTYKVGLGAPLSLPNAGERTIRVEDSEDHVVRRRVEGTDVVPCRSGRVGAKVGVSGAAPATGRAAELHQSIYLCLGAPLPDLPDALELKERRAVEEGSLREFVPMRFAVHEPDLRRLGADPRVFDGVDLAILTGHDDERSLAPLLAWVRNGGRLVVSFGPKASGLREICLRHRLPAPKAGGPLLAKNLVSVESWAGLQNKPFPPRGRPPVPIAAWDAVAPGAETFAEVALRPGEPSVPVLFRVPFGFGSVTFVGFALDGPEFSAWDGRVDFLRTLVDQLGPRAPLPEKTRDPLGKAESEHNDLGARLHFALDDFDVPSASFGWVALLVLLYGLLVGPIDYFVLRKCFGRLEWTWLTFPLMVGGVCWLAYRGLPQGETFRVNRLDLVDVDLRSATPRARWTSFLAARSPDIRTIDALSPQSPQAPDEQRESGDVFLPRHIDWFGRPDVGPAGMGRLAGTSVAPKVYETDGRSLTKIPFAHRGVKLFRSEATSADAGFAADLVYRPRESPLKVSGTIENRTGHDLPEAHLFVFGRVYPIEGGLPQGQSKAIAIREIDNGILPADWKDKTSGERPSASRGVYDPLTPLRFVMFHESLDAQGQRRNHALRPLDWSWRLRDDPRVVNVPVTALGVREAVLVARAPFAKNETARFARDSRSPGFADSATGEPLAGVEFRDVCFRVVVPLRPQP